MGACKDPVKEAARRRKISKASKGRSQSGTRKGYKQTAEHVANKKASLMKTLVKKSGGVFKSYLILDGKQVQKDKVYKILVERYGEVCGICGKEETCHNQHSLKRLITDHDHRTGEVRGLLCNQCNWKLGYLEDIEFVVNARLYLEKHS